MAFSQSSHNIHLENNSILVAQCTKLDGSRQQSRVDLKQYVGNKEGAFEVSGQYFSVSARRVRLEGSWLCADLRTSTGLWYEDSIDLDAFIGNNDGTLVVSQNVDVARLRPAGWQAWQRPTSVTQQLDQVVPPPADQCQLCQDWPQTYVWKRFNSLIEIKPDDLKSGRRRMDCPTCMLVERVFQSLAPRLARNRKIMPASLALRLYPQPTKFPEFDIEFETQGGEHRKVNCLMHSTLTEDNQSRYYSCAPRMVPLSGCSTSPKAISMAQGWLQSCVLDHKKCANAKQSMLPVRILDIGLRSEDVIKLRTTSGERAKYACLSHCWGLTKTLALAKSNHDELHKEIPWSSLQKTYTDAITFCRLLGIRYIWIDALCIVQDSADDWLRESAKMHSYYGDCYVCIAATSAADHDQGCRVQDFRVKHHGKDPDGLPYCVYVRPEVPHIMHTSPFPHKQFFPLLTRAWVYQERRLSPRVIHVTDMELFFECNTMTDCECGASTNYSVQDWTKAKESFFATHHDISDVEDKSIVVEHEWRSFVHAYSQLDLTKVSDRLPALSGLAQASRRRKEESNLPCGRYLAGCWEGSLINDLAWAVGPERRRMEREGESFRFPTLFFKTNPPAKKPKPEGYIAPSWSWACIMDKVDYAPFGYPDQLCRILEAHVDLATGDPYGQIKGGWLVLLAKLMPSRWASREGWTSTHASLLDIGNSRSFWSLRKNKGLRWWRDWADGAIKLHPGAELHLMPLAAKKLLGRTDSGEFNFKLGVTVTETVYLVLRAVDLTARPPVFERVGWASHVGMSGGPDFGKVRPVQLRLI